MRLIDADGLEEKMRLIAMEHTSQGVMITKIGACVDFIRTIDKQPTVDAVPVVRCNDCRYNHGKTCEKIGDRRYMMYCSEGRGKGCKVCAHLGTNVCMVCTIDGDRFVDTVEEEERKDDKDEVD